MNNTLFLRCIGASFLFHAACFFLLSRYTPDVGSSVAAKGREEKGKTEVFRDFFPALHIETGCEKRAISQEFVSLKFNAEIAPPVLLEKSAPLFFKGPKLPTFSLEKQEVAVSLSGEAPPKVPLSPSSIDVVPSAKALSATPSAASETFPRRKIAVAASSGPKFSHPLPPLQGVASEKQAPYAPLPPFPFLKELATRSCSSEFDVDLAFMPIDGEYIFAITLVAHPDISVPKLDHEITFLIDRSNSIQRERLEATKSGLIKALSLVDVPFNLFLFDNKAHSIFPSWVSPTAETRSMASAYLEAVTLGNFFSPADLARPLAQILSNPVKPDTVQTALLLTDGEALAKKETLFKLFVDWKEKNGGQVALYSLGMERDRCQGSMNAFIALNRGKHLFAATEGAFKRKIPKWVKSVSYPIAHHITPSIIPLSPNQEIELFHLAAPLFRDEPYLIFGKAKTLDDFILFVQAKVKGGYCHIKRKISFADGKKGGEALLSEIAMQRAYRCYADFLLDLNPEHIADAKEILRPHRLPPAFE